MTIEKQTYLYEVLIRGARDGSIAGAHQIHNEVLVDADTGEVLSEKPGLAAELATDDVAGLLGAAFMDNFAQVSALQAQIAELTAARDQSNGERDGALEQIAALQAQLAGAGSAALPLIISDRQFAHGLALRGLISRAEALAFVQTGALPAMLADYVAGIDDEARRFETTMLLSGAKELHRHHPLTLAIAEWLGMDAKALDDFWSQCGAL